MDDLVIAAQACCGSHEARQSSRDELPERGAMQSDEFMQVLADRVPKGRRKMYALTSEIRDVWDACGRVMGHPLAGGQLDLESLDEVAVALEHALVSIRTLDLEVFEASDKATYLATRDDLASRAGRTVRGLIAPRNNAVHHADVIDPDVTRAVGPMPGTVDRYLIHPRWKARADLPARMFQQQAVAQAYDEACARVSILDTLLDAFAFFDGLDPSLARRRADGSLEGFPLPPYDIATGYRRLTPDQPSERDWQDGLRVEIQAALPAGSRTILGKVAVAGRLVLCGDTAAGPGRTHCFTESEDQVVRDVGFGATYDVALAEGNGRCSVFGGVLVSPAGPVATAALRDLAGDNRPWADWWHLCEDDAEYYLRQRRPL